MTPNWMSRLRVLVGASLIAVACATAPKPAATAPRDRNLPSEKLAAQRAGAPQELTLEQDNERWGVEAARERRRQQDEAKARREPAFTDKNVNVVPAAR